MRIFPALIKVLLLPFLFNLLPVGICAGAEIRLPQPEIETLPNGLEVVWFANDQLPIVDFALLVKSGFRDDPPGKSGTVELLSGLLDRGAGGMSARDLAHSIEMLGASRYATPDEEAFSVGIHGLAPDAPELLELLGKMALHPDFPETEFQREHASVLDRWSHIEDYGETLVALAYRRQLMSGTMYGRGPFYSAAEFRKITRDDVIAFYHKHFTPKNSVLVIVGRVNRPEFRKKVEAVFGAWTGEAPVHDTAKFTDKRIPTKPGTILIVNRPELEQAQVRIGFRAPGLGNPDQYSLAIANALLGEYFNSRLNSQIRDKLGLTYSIGSSFSYNKELGIFTVSSSTRNESTGLLVHKILEILKGMKDGPIADEEIRTAKDYLIGGFPLGTATLGSVASRWAAGHVLGLSPDFLNEFVPKIRATTRQDVQGAVQRDFALKDLYIAIAGDAKAIKKSLADQKGLFPSRTISEKDLF